MRRRIPSAALRVHRYSLPQLVVDGVLVALAWHLAFTLRFDRIPGRFERLLDATWPWVTVGTLLVFFCFGLYQRRWSLLGLRDYEQAVGAGAVAIPLTPGAVALLPARHAFHHRHGGPPPGVPAVSVPPPLAPCLGAPRGARPGPRRPP